GRSAADKFAVNYTMNRAIEERANLLELNSNGKVKAENIRQLVKDRAANKPMDLADAKLADDILQEAAIDSAEAVFNSDNKLASWLTQTKGKLWKGGKLSQAGAFLLDQIAPFTRVPSNVVMKTVEPVTAIGRGLGAAGRTLKTKTLTATDQKLIAE